MAQGSVSDFLRVLVDPEQADLDIVAVHGLNPWGRDAHAYDTWTAAEGSLWLRDFLPVQLPSARVLLFGYNSNVAFMTSRAGVRQQAENLLNRLYFKRKAIVQAQASSRYSIIYESTYGLVFFATPHQGGNYARLGDIAAQIFRRVLRNEDNTFMEALKSDSLFADDLVRDFRERLNDFHVVSCYETAPLSKRGFNLGVIVDERSATLGLPTSREVQIGIAADHEGICKFNSIDGDDYELVSDNIVDLAQRAVAQRPQSQDQDASSTSEDIPQQQQQGQIMGSRYIGDVHSNGGPVFQGNQSAGRDFNLTSLHPR